MKKQIAIKLVKSVQETYNAIADHFSTSRWKIWDDLLYFSPFLDNSQSILDVGCGNGRLLALLSDLKVEYHGVDSSEELILQARKHHYSVQFEPRFQHADILDLQTQVKGEYDRILAVAVLQHIPEPLQELAISQLYSKLKPGGILLMTNWNLWQKEYRGMILTQVFNRLLKPWRKIEGIPVRNLSYKDIFVSYQKNDDMAGRKRRYVYAFTKYDIKNLLKSNGFSVIMYEYTDGHSIAGMSNGKNILSIAKKS